MSIILSMISGFSVGIEFPPPYDEDEVHWNWHIDLGIFRLLFLKYKD